MQELLHRQLLDLKSFHPSTLCFVKSSCSIRVEDLLENRLSIAFQ